MQAVIDLAAAPEVCDITLRKDAVTWKTCDLHDVRWADRTAACWCCTAGIPPTEQRSNTCTP